jgi:eukaryotic-like serine/threonine-protein kinase
MSLAAGTRFGPYEILSAVGAGGMGEVYRAKDTRLQRTVAIKVLPSHLSQNERLQKRFEQEARAVSALNHPNICTLHDIGSQDSLHYLVMEFLSGETLRDRLRSGALSARKCIEFGIQITQALGAAHEQGVVHRDLKPENIFITKEERIKILDFGLAQFSEKVIAGDVSVTPTKSKITDAGTIMGTVGYMSPEQVRGVEVDEKSDLFSVGVILYEALTGKRPFERETSAETMTAILREDAEEITKLNPNLPPVLATVIQRCLEKKPEQRFHSAHDLAFALQVSTSTSEIVRPTSTSAAERPRRNLRWLALLLLLPILLAVGLWIGRQTSKHIQPTFRAQTFRRGIIHSAILAPDGVTLIYGASLEPGPFQLYSGRTDSIESRKMDLPPADILGISKDGTMAILLNRHYLGSWLNIGTLAKVPVGGGSPREILENVYDAAISSDGNNFAIVRAVGGRQQLEFPIGNVIMKTDGWITSPRISTDGKRIAFIDHHILPDDRGFIALAEGGKVKRISDEFSGLTGLCWSRDEKTVWFTGAREGEDSSLWEAREGKSPRLILSAPTNLKILDLDHTGRVLLSTGDRRAELGGKVAGDETIRDLSWYGDEDLCGISADGTTLAATQTSQGSGKNYQVYFRRLDGSATVLLGPGNCEGFSPDGKWVLASTPSESQSHLILYPTGPGGVTKISMGNVRFTGRTTAGWSTDGKRVGILGTPEDNRKRAYVMSLPDGKLSAITSSETIHAVFSPDCEKAFAITADGKRMIYSLSGTPPQPVTGLAPDDWPFQWDATGTSLYVSDQSFPAKIYRVDTNTGARELWKEISPPDPLGVLYGRVLLTPNGQHYVYRFRRVLNRLYLAENLR